jgi:hypothetical protein
LVEPNNKYFWFNRPHWILLLIHYTLFQVCIYIYLYPHSSSGSKLENCWSFIRNNIITILNLACPAYQTVDSVDPYTW